MAQKYVKPVVQNLGDSLLDLALGGACSTNGSTTGRCRTSGIGTSPGENCRTGAGCGSCSRGSNCHAGGGRSSSSSLTSESVDTSVSSSSLIIDDPFAIETQLPTTE